MPAIQDIRSALAKVIDDRKLSCRDLAAKSGIHYTTISRFLNGHMDLSFDSVEALAKAAGLEFHVSLAIPPEKSA